MSYKLHLEIKSLPKILSNLSNNNWRTAHFNKKKFKDLIVEMARGKLPEKPLEKAKLTLIRHSSSEPDFDNLVISFKGPIDGLVKAGIIAGDKPSNIGQPTYKWERVKKNHGKITLTIEEVNELNRPIPDIGKE